jgi:membrane protein
MSAVGKSRIDRFRARHGWLNHLVLAGQRYRVSHGDHYAAAITYFSVLAVVPMLMIAFAVVGFVLAAHPALIDALKAEIATSVPGELGQTINDVVDQAIESRTAVGIIGLIGGAYSGLSWVGNLREALTAMWSQVGGRAAFVRVKAGDALALSGLGLAIVVSFAFTAAGSGFATDLLELVGLAEQRWAEGLLAVFAVILAVVGNWLVLLWVLSRLPREPVTLRGAAKAALAGAVGLEMLKQVGALYLQSLGGSPAAIVFGPVIGLLVFAYLVSRFLLFLTAWAATAPGNEHRAAPEPHRDAPPPAVIRPNVTVRSGPTPSFAATLLGAGTLLGLALARLRHGRGR